MGEAGAPLLAGPSDYSYISGLGRIDWIEDAHNKATRCPAAAEVLRADADRLKSAY